MSSEEEDTNDTKGDGGKKPSPRRRPAQEQCPHRSGVTTLPRRDELSQTEFSRLLAKKQGRIWYADPPRRRRNEVEYRRFRLDPVEEEPQEQSAKTIHVWKVAAARSLKPEKATLVTPSKIEDNSKSGANMIYLGLETSLKSSSPVEYKSQQVDTRDFNFMESSCDDISLVSTTGEDTDLFEGIMTSRPMTPMEVITEIPIPENVELELNPTQIQILEEEKPPTEYRIRAQESGPQIRPLSVQNSLNRSIDTEEILPMEARSKSLKDISEKEKHMNRETETRKQRNYDSRNSQAEASMRLSENPASYSVLCRPNLSDTEPQIFAKDEEMSRKHARVTSTVKHTTKKRIHENQNNEVPKKKLVIDVELPEEIVTSTQKTAVLSSASKKHKSESQNMSNVLQEKQTKEIKSQINREKQCIPNIIDNLDAKLVVDSANCDVQKSETSKNINENEEKKQNNSTNYRSPVINTSHSIKEIQSRLIYLSENQTKGRRKSEVNCENELISLPTNLDGKSSLNSVSCKVKLENSDKNLEKITKNGRKCDNKRTNNELVPVMINVASTEKTAVSLKKSSKQKLIVTAKDNLKEGNSEINGKHQVISSLTESLEETAIPTTDCDISSFDNVKLKESRRNLKIATIKENKQLHNNEERTNREEHEHVIADEKLEKNLSLQGENAFTGKRVSTENNSMKYKSLVAVHSTKKMNVSKVLQENQSASKVNEKNISTNLDGNSVVNSGCCDLSSYDNDQLDECKKKNHKRNIQKDDLNVSSQSPLQDGAGKSAGILGNKCLAETDLVPSPTHSAREHVSEILRTLVNFDVLKQQNPIKSNKKGHTKQDISVKNEKKKESTEETLKKIRTTVQEREATEKKCKKKDTETNNENGTFHAKNCVQKGSCSFRDVNREEEQDISVKNEKKKESTEETLKKIKTTVQEREATEKKCKKKDTETNNENGTFHAKNCVQKGSCSFRDVNREEEQDISVKNEKKKESTEETLKKIKTTVQDSVATEKKCKNKDTETNNENGTFYAKNCVQKGSCSFPDSNVNREEELTILNKTINKIVKATSRAELPFPTTEYNVYNTTILNKISKDSINAKVSKQGQKVTLKSHGFIRTNTKKNKKTCILTVQKEESGNETYKKITEEKLPSRQMFDPKTKTIREIDSSNSAKLSCDSAKSNHDLKLLEANDSLGSATMERVIRPDETEPSNGPIRKQLIEKWFKNANDTILNSREAASTSSTKPKTLTQTGSASSGVTQPKQEDNLTRSMVIKKPGISVESLPTQSEKINVPSLNLKVSEKDRRELFDPRGLAKEIMFLLKVILVANDYIITRDPTGSMSIERAPQSDSDEMLTPEDSDVDVVTRNRK